ncbi:MAG: hypothetical protein IKF78_13850 [Atopobiaceae bacterium]|nr:hypothetical protein [Atopobiaceae bacterium]
MEGEEELRSELEFMEAMRAYRRARESGDAEAIQKAEDAWRQQVRDELIAKEGCKE